MRAIAVGVGAIERDRRLRRRLLANVRTTLYRAAATGTGLAAIDSYKSRDSVDEEERGDECELSLGMPRAPFADLLIGCDEISTEWHNDDASMGGCRDVTRDDAALERHCARRTVLE